MQEKRVKCPGMRWLLLLLEPATNIDLNALCRRDLVGRRGGVSGMMFEPAWWIGQARRAVNLASAPADARFPTSTFFFLDRNHDKYRISLLPYFRNSTQIYGYFATMGPQPKGAHSRKRKLASRVEEINFDDTARHEFLTGFRKRKQQRIKHAQEVAEEKAREAKREERRRVSLSIVLSSRSALISRSRFLDA